VSMGGILLNVMEGLDKGTKEGNDELKGQRERAGASDNTELIAKEKDNGANPSL
jgi:hypothetical protein